MFMYPITDMQNRFIYCYKEQSEALVFPSFSRLNNNKQLLKINILSCKMYSSNYNNKNILFIKSIISNTDINNKQKNVFKWRK